MSKTLIPNDVAGDELLPGVRLGVKVIARIGYVKDWAAYQGPTDWTDYQVAENGDKLSREAGEALFPICVRAGLRYRT